jgi:abequosyltransferase
MSRPLLTIAIPTYNRADLLDLCLSRVLSQADSYPEAVEVLVSNNAATDHTKQVVAKHQAEHPALRYSENEQNGGPDYNIAKCFELATAKYVWVFSDDDILLPNAVDHIMMLLKQQELGIIVLATNFYRHSIHEFVPLNEPLTYKLYDDPAQLATEVHFWLTYISGIITNKELVNNAVTLYQYQNSFMIQLGWVIPALFWAKQSARISTPLILGRSLEVLDFKLFHVFGTSYPVVLEGLAQQGVLPVHIKEVLIERIIKDYFPVYIQPSTRYTHGERPLIILGKAFWKRKSFWTMLVPLFIRRQLVRGLQAVQQPLWSRAKSIVAEGYGRIAALHQAAKAASLTKHFRQFGADSYLPEICYIPHPEYVAIGRSLRALPGLIIEAHTMRGEEKYFPAIDLGNYVRFGANCRLDCCVGIKIGDWVMIGHQVIITDNELDDTPVAIQNYLPANRRLVSKGPITIANNVLIEDNVRILSGVVIGQNAIIKAGSVVHNSVPANSIVAGNPARVVEQVAVQGSCLCVDTQDII